MCVIYNNLSLNGGVIMKKIITLTLTAAVVFVLSACGREPVQTPEESTVNTSEAIVTVTASETSATETVLAELPAWEGSYHATDTEEHFEISEVTDEGFYLIFYHFEEGQIEQFKYKMEFDDPEKTTASEIGPATKHGGWEYTFIFQGDSILVKSKHPDQTYIRVEE